MKKWSVAIFSWLIILSGLSVFMTDSTVLTAKAEPTPLEIINTTYYINSSLTIDTQPVIIKNSTIYLNENFVLKNYNVSIENSTFIFNPTANRQYWIYVYGGVTPTILTIRNSTFMTSTSYTYGGLYFTGHLLDVYMDNITVGGIGETVLREVNNAYVNRYIDRYQAIGDYYFVAGEHDTNDRGFYGYAIVENSEMYRFICRVVWDTISVNNSTIGYVYAMQGWGTTNSYGNEYNLFYNDKGQTKIYQWATLHITGNDTGVFLETPEGRIYVRNNSALWLHTWNAFENTDLQSLDICVGSNRTKVKLPAPDYHHGQIDIYIDNRNDTINVEIPSNMTYQPPTTGAVGTEQEQSEIPILAIYSILTMNFLTLILLIAVVLVSFQVVRIKRRGGMMKWDWMNGCKLPAL